MSPTLIRTSLCVVVLLVLQGSSTAAEDTSPYRMEGVVTEEGTNQPVAGATAQVLIESERDPAQRTRSAKTDATGKYSVPLPIGHGWSWGLQPPAGYYLVQKIDFEEFATTPEELVFKKDYQVRKGIAWPALVRVPHNTKFDNIDLSSSQKREPESFSALNQIAADGHGAVTIPADAEGEFRIYCFDHSRALETPEKMKLVITKGFRNDRVASLKQLPDGVTELRDDEGRIATLHGMQAQVKDGAAMLVLEMKHRSTTDDGLIAGRVVDSLDQPIAGAMVVAALYDSRGASGTTPYTATSQADGTFRLSIPKPPDDQRVALVVTKDDYAGIDTEPRPVDFAKSTEVDFGSIKLQRGSSIRVRIVDSQGKALAGAIIEPTGSYAERKQIARTDADGMCTLKNLPAGLVSVYAKFGKMWASTKVPIVEGDNEPLVLKVTQRRDQTAGAAKSRPKALATGTIAPEWAIAEWTDGATRKLADYRGKVVVLDFWGVWCGPCVRSIPAMKQLHERYKDQDVVFIGIHTAGTDMSLVKRLIDQQEWQTITGLDTGEDIASGASVGAFAVNGFPTVMVIDREGKIAFNTDYTPGDQEQAMKEFMKRAEEDAKSLGLPWPIDKDATQEELRQRLTKLQVLQLSREIDRALKID